MEGRETSEPGENLMTPVELTAGAIRTKRKVHAGGEAGRCVWRLFSGLVGRRLGRGRFG